MYDTGRIRISDADRESVVARLTAATAEGRLTLTEFEERTGQAYASRTWRELVVVLEDLPHAPLVPVVPQWAPPAQTYAPAADVPGGSQNTLGIIAMVVGIASLVGLSCVPVAPLLGIGAVVLGILGLRRARELPDGAGRGFSWAGIATGASGIALATTLIISLGIIT